MSLIRFPLSCLLLLHAVSTISYAKEAAARGNVIDLQMAQQETNEALNATGASQDTGVSDSNQRGQGQTQGQQNPGYFEGQTSQNPRANQAQGSDEREMDSQGTQGQQRLMQGQDAQRDQQGLMQGQGTQQNQQRLMQGQDQKLQDSQYQQGQGTQNQSQGQQNPRSSQGQQDPSDPAQSQQDPNARQGQGTNSAPNIQGQRGQDNTIQPGAGPVQDQLPPDAPQVKPPKKPRVLPSPTPTQTKAPAPTFVPAPPPETSIPEPISRPQPSGPKTDQQKSYESAMQTRWKVAADEITQLRTRGESLQGKKGKAFRESLRTASGNRSMARTKLNQLVRGQSADFDKLKTGVERAFADLDYSIARVRSYFDEPPSP